MNDFLRFVVAALTIAGAVMTVKKNAPIILKAFR